MSNCYPRVPRVLHSAAAAAAHCTEGERSEPFVQHGNMRTCHAHVVKIN